MRKLNTTTFFAYVRKLPFGGKLTQQQVDGTTAILAAFKAAGGSDPRHLAYILATAFHETGGRMVPVREGFAKSDVQARKIVAKYKYGQTDARADKTYPIQTGHVFYGRGQVQLTWQDNYERMGKILSIDLVNNPDLALDSKIGAQILVEGMMRGASNKGDFTGQCVENYFNDAIDDPIGARRIVNGTDKAKLIADYYKAFRSALEASQDAAADGQLPSDVTVKDSQADRPNLMTDKTTLGTVTAVASSGIFGAFSAIDSPYALGALVVLVIAAGVFWYGRQRIITKGGV